MKYSFPMPENVTSIFWQDNQYSIEEFSKIFQGIAENGQIKFPTDFPNAIPFVIGGDLNNIFTGSGFLIG